MTTKSRNIQFALMMLLATFLTASCANTQLKSQWDSAGVEQISEGKILVAGLTDNPERRDMYEKAMVNAFREKGMDGFAAGNLLADSEYADEKAVIAKARRQGVGFALVTRILEMGVTQVNAPVFEPMLTTYFSGDMDDYGQVQKYLKTERVEQHHIKLESNLYDVKTGKLIWTGVSETFKPGSKLTPHEVLSSVTGVVTNELDMLSKKS